MKLKIPKTNTNKSIKSKSAMVKQEVILEEVTVIQVYQEYEKKISKDYSCGNVLEKEKDKIQNTRKEIDGKDQDKS